MLNKVIFACILGALWSITIGFAGTTQINLPLSGFPVEAIFEQNTDGVEKLWIAQGGSVYTRDTGKKWKEVFKMKSLNGSVIKFDYSHGSRLMMAVTTEGIYIAENNLKKWQRIFIQEAVNQNVLDGVMNRANSAQIAVATDKMIHVTSDKGRSWREYRIPFDEKPQQIFWTDNTSHLWIVSLRHIYKFDLNSKAFSRFRSFHSPEGLSDESENGNAFASIETSALVSPKRVWIDGAGRGVSYLDGSWIRSVENGLTKGVPGIPTDVEVAPVSIGHHGVVIASGHRAFFLSSQEGASINEVTPGQSMITCLYYDEFGDELYIADLNGLYRLDKFAATQLLGKTPEVKNSEEEILMSLFENEPDILLLQDIAMKYAEVHPDKIRKWRKQASLSQLLPDVSFSVDRGRDEVVELDRGGTNDPDQFIQGPDESDMDIGISATWKLSEIIWNPDQTSIDNRSKLMVQLREDVLSRLNSAYFSRRQLIIERSSMVNADAFEKAEKELQIQELEAIIDGLTGGYFSHHVRRAEIPELSSTISNG